MPDPSSITTTQLSVIEETTPGTTPPTPAFQVIPFLPDSVPPTLEANIVQSEIITGNRQPGPSCAGTVVGRATIHTYLSDELAIRLLLEGAFWGDFAANALGSDLAKHFYTVEARMMLADGSFTYRRLTGAMVGQATITMPNTGCVEVTFEMVGKWVDTPAIFAGATYVPPVNKVPVAVSCDASRILYNVLETDVETAEITINNNLDPAYAIGSPRMHHARVGNFVVEGSMGIYYTGETIFQDFISATRRQLAFELQACGSNYGCVILIPRALLTASPLGTSGTDLINNATFRAEQQGVEPAISITFAATAMDLEGQGPAAAGVTAPTEPIAPLPGTPAPSTPPPAR